MSQTIAENLISEVSFKTVSETIGHVLGKRSTWLVTIQDLIDYKDWKRREAERVSNPSLEEKQTASVKDYDKQVGD